MLESQLDTIITLLHDAATTMATTHALRPLVVTIMALLPSDRLSALASLREATDLAIDEAVQLSSTANGPQDAGAQRLILALVLLRELSAVSAVSKSAAFTRILGERTDTGALLPHVQRWLQNRESSSVKLAAEELAFALCDSNASKLISAVGIGNAAGVLHAKGLMQV